jgi:hypothetical protein
MDGITTVSNLQQQKKKESNGKDTLYKHNKQLLRLRLEKMAMDIDRLDVLLRLPVGVPTKSSIDDDDNGRTSWQSMSTTSSRNIDTHTDANYDSLLCAKDDTSLRYPTTTTATTTVPSSSSFSSNVLPTMTGSVLMERTVQVLKQVEDTVCADSTTTTLPKINPEQTIVDMNSSRHSDVDVDVAHTYSDSSVTSSESFGNASLDHGDSMPSRTHNKVEAEAPAISDAGTPSLGTTSNTESALSITSPKSEPQHWNKVLKPSVATNRRLHRGRADTGGNAQPPSRSVSPPTLPLVNNNTTCTSWHGRSNTRRQARQVSLNNASIPRRSCSPQAYPVRPPRPPISELKDHDVPIVTTRQLDTTMVSRSIKTSKVNRRHSLAVPSVPSDRFLSGSLPIDMAPKTPFRGTRTADRWTGEILDDHSVSSQSDHKRKTRHSSILLRSPSTETLPLDYTKIFHSDVLQDPKRTDLGYQRNHSFEDLEDNKSEDWSNEDTFGPKESPILQKKLLEGIREEEGASTDDSTKPPKPEVGVLPPLSVTIESRQRRKRRVNFDFMNSTHIPHHERDDLSMEEKMACFWQRNEKIKTKTDARKLADTVVGDDGGTESLLVKTLNDAYDNAKNIGNSEAMRGVDNDDEDLECFQEASFDEGILTAWVNQQRNQSLEGIDTIRGLERYVNPELTKETPTYIRRVVQTYRKVLRNRRRMLRRRSVGCNSEDASVHLKTLDDLSQFAINLSLAGRRFARLTGIADKNIVEDYLK